MRTPVEWWHSRVKQRFLHPQGRSYVPWFVAVTHRAEGRAVELTSEMGRSLICLVATAANSSHTFSSRKMKIRNEASIFVARNKVSWNEIIQQKQNKLRGLSPRTNYTDGATDAHQRSLCQLLRIKGTMVNVTDPFDPILGFLDWSRYFFFQAAPQLYSRGWVDPVPDPLLLRKSGRVENRTRTSGSVV
jgi:hypothetical protein